LRYAALDSSPLADQREYFPCGGVAPHLLLGEEQVSVHRHLEHAPGGRCQLDLDAGEVLLQLSRQTGGSWLVVSNDAVFDPDAHRCLVVRVQWRIVAAAGNPAKCAMAL
jgi:hypothetical protein